MSRPSRARSAAIAAFMGGIELWPCAHPRSPIRHGTDVPSDAMASAATSPMACAMRSNPSVDALRCVAAWSA